MPLPTLTELLRQTRKDKGLSQQDLGAKLGLRQSQISDLERAAVDPRFSTVRDVARALDLEFMLIPRALIPTVEGLLRGATATPQRPLYTLDEPERTGETDGPVRAPAIRPVTTDRARRRRRMKTRSRTR